MTTQKTSSTPWLSAFLLISGMILCILKGSGNLDWSWWVVLIPLYPIILVWSICIVVWLFCLIVLVLAVPLAVLGVMLGKK